MLACKRFKGRHTAENVVSNYEEVLSDYEIGNKISHVITDNASNMIKAFSLPGYKQSSPASSEATESFEGSFSSDSDSDEENEADATNLIAADNSDFAFLPKHHGCFAHSLQLVVKDGMKECGHLRKIISKASTIVAHVRRSVHATEFLENFNRLQRANATRRNSELKMIRSVLNMTIAILNELDTSNKLTAYERNLLSSLCDILEPFAIATDYTQGEKCVTSSYVIPCIRGLKEQLSKMDTRYHGKLITAFMQSISKRFESLEYERPFQMASLLDPRFKLAWCKSHEAELIKSYLLMEAVTMSNDKTEPTSSASDSEPPQKRCRLFGFMGRIGSSPNSEKNFEKDLQEYLREACLPENTDPLLYRQSKSVVMPSLAKLAKKYLMIPATSASVERLFSVAGRVYRPDRCRLSDKRFEYLLFIKTNMHFKA